MCVCVFVGGWVCVYVSMLVSIRLCVCVYVRIVDYASHFFHSDFMNDL